MFVLNIYIENNWDISEDFIVKMDNVNSCHFNPIFIFIFL